MIKAQKQLIPAAIWRKEKAAMQIFKVSLLSCACLLAVALNVHAQDNAAQAAARAALASKLFEMDASSPSPTNTPAAKRGRGRRSLAGSRCRAENGLSPLIWAAQSSHGLPGRSCLDDHKTVSCPPRWRDPGYRGAAGRGGDGRTALIL